jgi:hypothetical protein
MSLLEVGAKKVSQAPPAQPGGLNETIEAVTAAAGNEVPVYEDPSDEFGWK